VDLVIQQIQLACQALNLRLCATVNLKIKFTAQPVLCVLSILTHHDDWSLDSRHHGKEQIEENEWIWVPGALSQNNVDGCVNRQRDRKPDNKGPGAAEVSNRIRYSLSKSRFLFNHFIRVAVRANPHQFLRGMELAAEGSEQIHARHGF